MFDGQINNYRSVEDFGQIKVGVKKLEDAILNLGTLKDTQNTHIPTKREVVDAIAHKDYEKLRILSNLFYDISGLYESACNYAAFLYRYDWYVVPVVLDDKDTNNEKILKDFSKTLDFLDNSYVKKLCGDIALSVAINGCYYGYIVYNTNNFTIQELPIKYCRTRYSVNGNPAVEFNMKFFDEKFRDPNYRLRVLKLFPDEFSKGYLLYKQGKLAPDYPGDTNGSWYLLDPELTVKFNFNNNDVPIFINAIPAILDLDAAQDLDRKKQMQKLLKIVIQQLPLDKNGDLIFDVDEAKDIHNNAVEMLRKAVGVDVITTFADVKSIDTSDKNSSTTVDDLLKVERTVFNALGISQNLFNTDGNLSLDKSILNDESSLRSILLQFQMFFDRIIAKQSPNKKKYHFKLYMLETTQYNYKDLSKMYKEQVQIGYSKMLPQIALGHSQSFILNSAFFENDVLDLNTIMVPPLMSSTMNGEDILGKKNQENTQKTQTNIEPKNTSGRPEKPDDQKSEKTIANKESMS